jgi:hypothetical protein
MMKTLAIIVLSLAGGMLGSYLLPIVGPSVAHFVVPVVEQFGATTARTTVTNPWTFSATTTFSGKSVLITSANTATSTLVVGCWQFYATSTATALKYQASTTPGIMYSQYGTCPNL